MPMYVIYDRETGDVLRTQLSPGPIELGEELVEDLVASGRLGRAAFVEADPEMLPIHSVLDGGRSLRARPIRATVIPVTNTASPEDQRTAV